MTSCEKKSWPSTTTSPRSCLKHQIQSNELQARTNRVSFDETNLQEKQTHRSDLFQKKAKEYHSDEFNSFRMRIKDKEPIEE